jgi:prophage regulatory protein
MPMLRMPAVKTETGHRSHASLYNLIKEGLFTKPVLIGQRAVAWPSEEVYAINAARIAGMRDEEIRQLVTSLHEKRKSVMLSLPDVVANEATAVKTQTSVR